MVAVPLDQAFRLAVAHHQAGRLAEAEGLYRQILGAQPNHAGALHLLGVIADQVGRHEVAVELIQKAIALAPNVADFHSNLGAAQRNLGRFDEAMAEFRRAIQLQPDHADAHNNLGSALIAQGVLGEAVTVLRRTIELRPTLAEAHNNLGIALGGEGRGEEAVAACRRAVELQPGYANGYNSLGVALVNQRELAEAIAAFRRAIAVYPDYVEAYCNLGNALVDEGSLDEAVATCRRAIEIRPNHAEAHNNLGVALIAQGALQEAGDAFRRALELQPNQAESHSNLSVTLMAEGRLDEAGAELCRAIELQPQAAQAKFNYSLQLLLQGDFEQGWPLYESRWGVGDLRFAKRDFPQPMWRGEPLHGQRVLIYAEQGLGDTLQFVRYAPLIAERGGHVILECQPELKSLFTSLEGVAEIIVIGDPLPDFELHCRMMSLPLAFGTRVETIPATIPYLRADPAGVRRWKERLEGNALKVGLVWAGGMRPRQLNADRIDRRRSVLLGQLAPFAEVPGVVFVSLQKGPPAEQAKTPPVGMTLLDWSEELRDFAETAALVECLDLVITVDTAVAHLAGALGKPVWLLNRFDTCWRWLLGREDSPWYPTMRIFRQPKFGDWSSAIDQASAALAKLVSDRG
ncbi:TPR repeat-containing protein [Chthoniobacter flavus Ellin428]|uniref:TPR repeat-containing protein n=1 Tax=Chthoniobacter flavus Ellin428 TaxID=497964 RepID=B4CV49_9BACT|nr:tetratricopeptide repeat protein [Chthoniobacter flavus]EDY22437.1 TPR repeat-containing protein [Chthoniobacter flavus Ellin428]TCO94554.1 tetratricopeptide (TPR) repeat protein [Chthoniobacter flavus]